MKPQYITSLQMAKVDELAVKSGLSILQMMENEGRNFASFVLKLKPKKVIVFYGKGNNGGGGLSAARHLALNKIPIEIIPAEKTINENVKHQLAILKLMNINPKKSPTSNKNSIIIDALLGYNIKGNPRPKYANLINIINYLKNEGSKVVSVDIPSGMDPNSGKKYIPAIKADYTLTLALPKKGLIKLKNVFLVDIKIPPSIYKKLKIKPFYFNKEIVKIS